MVFRQFTAPRIADETRPAPPQTAAKFTKFDGTPAMKGILGTGENSVDWGEAMDSGRIVLVDLSKAALGERSSRLLGFLILNSLCTAALQRTHATGRRPFSVFVDEVQSFSAGTLPDMLSEGRKFGLSVVVARQYLGQLDPKLRTALDGNVGTTVAFGCAAADAPEIAARFGGQLPPSTFATLPGMGAISMRTAGGVAPTPFSVTVDHNARMAEAGLGSVVRLEQIEAVVRRQTLDALVEPFRDSVGLFEEPRSSRVRRRIETAGRSAPTQGGGKPAPAPSGGSGTPGFLDDWLAKRAQQEPREAPKDHLQPPGGE